MLDVSPYCASAGVGGGGDRGMKWTRKKSKEQNVSSYLTVKVSASELEFNVPPITRPYGDGTLV